MKARLTLLQPAVIQRLRDAGYPALAGCASSCWSDGHPSRLPTAIRDPELAADYEKANAQASAVAED